VPAGVSVAALEPMGIAPDEFARRLLARAAAEQRDIDAARARVRAKGEWPGQECQG